VQADYFRTWGSDIEQGALLVPGTAFADASNAVRLQLQASF
jgi:hypothetical protein